MGLLLINFLCKFCVLVWPSHWYATLLVFGALVETLAFPSYFSWISVLGAKIHLAGLFKGDFSIYVFLL